MGEIIRFETNVPQFVALKYPDGKEVEGRFGPQYLFTTVTGDTMYVPPIVASKINLLEVKPGEPIQILKKEKTDGRKKSIEWVITRTAAPVQEGAPFESNPTPGPALVTSQQRPVQANGNPPIVHTQTSQAMTGCLVAAIDSLLTAQQYAASKGMELHFNEEDVRAVGATLYIQYSRAYEGKGGNAWQQ